MSSSLLRRRFRRLALASAAAAVVVCVPRAQAVTRDWTFPGNGVFSQGTNWSGAIAPGAVDTASFNLNATYAVTFNANATTAAFNFGQGTVNFSSSGGTRTFTAGASAITGGSLTLNTINLAASSLAVRGGAVLTANASSGLSSSGIDVGVTGGDGTLIVDNSIFSAAGGVTSIGGSGNNGVVTFRNNAVGSLNALGLAPSGFAGSTGTFNVQTGADVTAGNVTIGAANLAGQVGTLNVTGAGSTLAQNGAATLVVGAATSTGSVAVSSGGVYTTGTGLTSVNALGQVTVGGAASAFNAKGDLLITGGTITVDAAANFTMATGQALFQAGGAFTKTGDHTIGGGVSHNWTATGAGSKIDVSGILRVGTGAGSPTLAYVNGAAGTLGQLFVSDSNGAGQGLVQVSTGAALTAGNVRMNTTFAAGQHAQIDVTGAGSTLTQTGASTLVLGAASSSNAEDARINLAAGGLFNSGTGPVTVNPKAVISLNGGTFTANGDITFNGGKLINSTPFGTSIFTLNAANLTVTNGGSVNPNTLRLSAGAHAILVDGAGSSLTTDSVQFTGSTTTITVDHGAAYSQNNSLSLNANQKLLVPDGSLTVGGNINVFTGALINKGANGAFTWAPNRAMTISGGGQFNLATAGGFATPSNTTVTVTGANSLLNVTGSLGDINVTSSALNVTAGGRAAAAGSFRVEDGTILVDGAGSALVAAGLGSSTIGFNTHPGVLTFSNGASGTMSGGIILADAVTPAASGVLNVLSGATVSARELRTSFSVVFAEATATANVSGAGSVLTLTGVLGGLSIGAAAGAASSVNVTDGGSLVLANNAAGLVINPTGTLNVDGGFVTLNGVTNNGTLNFVAGAITLNAPFTVGTGGLLGKDVTLGASKSLTVAGTTTIAPFRTLTLNGGTLNTNGLVNNGAFAFNGGVLGFTGPDGLAIAAAGPLGSSLALAPGKTLNVTNALDIAPGASLNLNGGNLSAGSVTNQGTLSLTGGGAITVTSTLLNLSSGRLFVGPDASYDVHTAIDNAGRTQLQGGAARLGGAGTFHNTGLVTGDGEIAKAFNNATTGEVRADAGKTLLFSAATSNNIGLITLAGGTVEFTELAGNATAGQVTGHGTFIAHAGHINQGTFSFSGGDSDVFGGMTNSAFAKLIVTGGATATFHGPISAFAGAEVRVSTNSAAVFLAPVNGPITFTGAGAKYFEAGVSAAGPIAAGGVTVVEQQAAVTADHVLEASLTVNGQFNIRPNSQTSKVNALTIAAGGHVDLANNAIIVDYTGPSPLLSLRAAIASGALGSSALTPDTALGYAEASAVLSATGGPFLGQSADGTAVLVRYTIVGDANLDGAVGFADLVAVAQHYDTLGTGLWSDGDFDHDGNVGFADLVTVAQHYDLSLGAAAAIPGASADFNRDLVAAFAAVPEPSATLTLLAACGLATRRRRRIR